MCVTLSRQCGGTEMSADRAGAFAGASVISALSMADWQVSVDAEAAMSSAVNSLPDHPDLLTVVLHRDRIDIEASSGSTTSRRRCFPRQPFGTSFACRDEPAVTIAEPARG